MLARFKLCKKVPMSEVATVTNENISGVSETDTTENAKLKQQYREQYQQLLSQYENASAAWHNTASDVQTNIGEAVCLAIDNQLEGAKTKLDALKAAVEASEPSETTLKTAAEACKASVSNVAAYIAAVPTVVADTAAIMELRETREGLSEADEALLGTKFTQAIEAKFTAFNAKIAELKKAVEDGSGASAIEKLQSEISGLKTQLSTLINGTEDGAAMSIRDRIECFRSLETGKNYLSEENYTDFKKELLQTDISKQISKNSFETQLDKSVLDKAENEAKETVEKNEEVSKHAASLNALLKNNIGLKVMREKNSFLEFKLNTEADAKLQEKAEFNPQVKQLRDEGSWQTPDVTRQQEMVQELNEDERRREKTAQMR